MHAVSSSLLVTGWSYLVCGPADQNPLLTDWNCFVWRVVDQHSPPAGRSCSHCRAVVAFHCHVSQKHSWLDISDLSCTSLSLWRQTRYFQPRGRRLQNQKPGDTSRDRSKWAISSSFVFQCFICQLDTYRRCIKTWPEGLLGSRAFVLLSSAGWDEQKHLCWVCSCLDIRKSFGPATTADQPHEGEDDCNNKILLKTKE